MAFRPLHWATEMLNLIDMSGYEGEALAEQGMDGSLQRTNVLEQLGFFHG